MTKEFICMDETSDQTQKVIRQWLSTDYPIVFISQSLTYIYCRRGLVVVPSLFRIKE